MPTRSTIFTTIRTEGALLPADLLQRITDGTNIDGLTPESYHRPGEKINEAINRSWNALQGAWLSFKTAQERLPSDDLGTSITRERWLLPLFRELDYGRLQTATAAEIDGRTYPISHRWEHVPLHLVSYKLDLDKRTPGATGAAIASPHSLLQVFLNRSDANLWGFLSNGYRLRILRDNASLTRQSYVEFDLEAMMTGEVYSDFVLLWLLCHQSRVEGERPSDCWLEKWMKVAEDQGTRALDQLRNGVEQAITALGLGFLEHPANSHLRDKLQSGALDGQDYYRQLLRLVYRMLFLFVAEDRSLLLDPAADEAARDRYTKYYSTGRLRHMAEHFKGTQHPDLYEALRLVMHLLSGESTPPSLAGEAGRGLALLPLGSFLFSDEAVSDIITCQMSNAHLLDAIRALSLTYDTRAAVYRSVDYRNLGPEELGSIYESLLELHPQINVPARTFALATAGGNERKTTGSYYTPTSLINALLDSALDPVLNEAMKKGEAAILALKICDPACGSGHFLIAAANRIAKALATVRTGDEEPAPAAIQEAKRDVIGHCIYGVDINPMAVELCKVNLWMEALEPGKPLSFLDHRIQCGNSLLGTTPSLMAQGIPDDAFTPIEGDDPKFVTTMKKLNRDERKQREASVRQLELFGTAPAADYTALTRAMHELDATPDDTLAEIRRKEAQYAALASDPEYVKARLLADAWCAAFVWEKKSPSTRSGEGLGEGMLPPSPVTMGEGPGLGVLTPPPFTGEAGRGFPLPLTDLLYRRLEADPLAENLRETREYIVELTRRYQFFHWHIAFPDVFTVDTRQLIADDGAAQTGWIGGFDCVLGNPPWDQVELGEKEFFWGRAIEIANAPTARQRRQMIDALKVNDPYLHREYLDTKRQVYGTRHFVQTSGMFPLSSMGRINLYPLFSEISCAILSTNGRSGVIIPSNISMDTYNVPLFKSFIENRRLASMFDFENRSGLFPAVDSRFRFCLLILRGSGQNSDGNLELGYLYHNVDDIRNEERRIHLRSDEIVQFSPNTLSPPIFYTERDTNLARKAYTNFGVLINENVTENLWLVSIQRMLSLSDEGDIFRSVAELQKEPNPETWARLYAGKVIHAFNHRYSNYSVDDWVAVTTADLQNPSFVVSTEYYVKPSEVEKRLVEKQPETWLIAYREITNATNERTMIAACLPVVGTDTTFRNIYSDFEQRRTLCGFVANLNTFVFDYFARQKVIGTHLSATVLQQLPVVPPSIFTLIILDFIVPRVLELTYTAWDLQPFAQDVGYNGPPFIWDDERRFLMRCELDALYFHLYQINRADVDYIMETFPIVKRKDIAATAGSPRPEGEGQGGEGYYRTKDTILAMYDQMAALPTLHVPAPKSPPPDYYGEGQGVGSTYPVPDVSHWQTWLTPPPASPDVAHPSKDN